MNAFNGFLICVVLFSSLSRSRAALRLAATVEVVEVKIEDPSDDVFNKDDWECGENEVGDKRLAPGPHLDNGLLKININ